MTKIILYIFLLLHLTLYSQNQKVREDSLINNIELDLNKKGITDYFTYRVIDDYYMFDVKETGESGYHQDFRTYIFWSAKNGNYVIKIDAKNIYKELKIEGNEMFDFLNMNITKILSEKIKPYQEKRNGKLIEIGSSSNDYILFNFKINKVLTTKLIRTFDLKNEPNFPNYNYEHNCKLKLIIFNDICKKLTEKLESQKLFLN